MYPGKGDTLRRGDTPRRGDIQAEEPWRKAGSPGSPGVPDVPVQRGGDTAAGTQEHRVWTWGRKRDSVM